MQSHGRRVATLLVFAFLFWMASQPANWGQEEVRETSRQPDQRDRRAVPGYGRAEFTFETTREGFRPMEFAGPLTYPDMMRLLLRRSGDFRRDITARFRLRRRAPEADLWAAALPDVFKVRIFGGQIAIVKQPQSLRLGVNTIHNLPLIIRNDLSSPVDVKTLARPAGVGSTQRFTADPGLTYGAINLRPTSVGPTQLTVDFYAGVDAPAGGPPPESKVAASGSFPLEVVGWGTLKLKTLEQGKPVHARVYVTGSDGLSYSPAGTLSRITWTSGDYYYYSRGEHEIWLPEGSATLEALRGFEYGPAKRTVEISAGQTSSATLDLRRLVNMAKEGWYSGDVHVHVNYSYDEFLTPRDVRLQILGEDLNVPNLVVANRSGAHIHDEQYFEGRPHRLSGARHILSWGEEMRNRALYGHLCLIGIKSLIKPIYTGFPGTPHPYDCPVNHEQAHATIRQGGAVSYAHPAWNFPSPELDSISARELPVDLALGSVDAMDVLSNQMEDASTDFYYALLNTGLKLAISAGTDSLLYRRHHWIPGGSRVYVYAGERLDYTTWIQNYKAGQSFATNGPILGFTVNGRRPGAELHLAQGQRVKVEASAVSVAPMEKLEIVANGKVIASAGAEEHGTSVSLSEEIALDQSAWLAARIRGPYHRYVVNDAFLYAHSSPVYCYVDGKKISSREDGTFFVNWIDQLIRLVRERGRYESETQRGKVITLFEEARAYYEGVARGGA